jgi:hypothetical protein
MPDTQKSLQLSLKFTADTAQGSKALQALGADLAKLEQAAGRAQKALTATGGGAPLASSGAPGVAGARPDTVTAAILGGMDKLTNALRDLERTIKYGTPGGGVGGAPAPGPAGGGGGGSPAPGPAGGDKEGFSWKGFALKVTTGTVALAALTQTVTNLHEASAQLNHNWLTTNERALNFARAIPLVGDALAKLGSSVIRMLDRIGDPATS